MRTKEKVSLEIALLSCDLDYFNLTRSNRDRIDDGTDNGTDDLPVIGSFKRLEKFFSWSGAHCRQWRRRPIQQRTSDEKYEGGEGEERATEYFVT